MIEKIKETDINAKKMTSVATRPNSTGLYGTPALTANELKAKMDALPLLAIDKINEIIEGFSDGGEVAKSLVFKYGENKYSLADLVAMIFIGNGISDILMTDMTDEGISLNTALQNLNIGATNLNKDVSDLKDANESISNEFVNHKAEINNILIQISEEINGAFDSLIEYADSLGNEVVS